MPLDLVTDLAHGLDPAIFARTRLDFAPDDWQSRLLRSQSRQVILNCCRQSGKSTTTALLALHTALYDPGSLTLLVSPSQRQSRELFAKVMDFLRQLEPVERLDEDNRLSATLRSGSRIVSLPGDPKTVRGYSAPALVVEDEAAYVDDALYAAIRPMLAVSRGRLILMSTPAGKRGHYHDVWTNAEGWERIRITGGQCPRITAEFLEAERRELGPLFDQEYCGAFLDDAQSMFDDALISNMFAADFPLLELA